MMLRFGMQNWPIALRALHAEPEGFTAISPGLSEERAIPLEYIPIAKDPEGVAAILTPLRISKFGKVLLTSRGAATPSG